MQNVPGVVTNTRIPYCIWDKPNLLANTSLCSDSSQYTILSQSLVQIGLIFWWKCLKTTFSFFIGQPGFCLIFILSKNKVFQSGALLKMPPSSRNLVSNKSTLKKCSFQLWKQEFWSNKNHPDKYFQHQVLPCTNLVMYFLFYIISN